MPTIRTATAKPGALTVAEGENIILRPAVIKSADYSLTAAHNREFHELAGTTATVTLPTVSASFTETDDWFVDLKNTLTTNITIDRNSQNIDGAAANFVLVAGASVRIRMNYATTGFYTQSFGTTKSPTIQKFTSNGTWTKPAGCRKVIVEVVGPGGGGGGSANPGSDEYTIGGGGGAGGYTKAIIDVTSISSSTITIGTGGAGGTAGASGSSGSGASSWADGTNTVSANAGSGGSTRPATSAAFARTVAYGAGGSATSGGWTLEIAGENGYRGWSTGGSATDIIVIAGNGANSMYGRGGVGAVLSNTGAIAGGAGAGYGSGGAGGVSYENSASPAATSSNGGAGANGVVIVTEFY